MDYCAVILCLVFATILDRCGGQAAGPSAKYREEAIQIINSIFHKYNKGVAPLPHPDPVSLDTHMTLVTVQDLDRDAQYLDSVVDLAIEWNDSRLQWYPLLVSKITVELDKVWKPDISILNALEPSVIVTSPELAVKSSGTIFWYRRLRLRTYCRTNSSYTTEPVECAISVGSRLYHKKEQDFNKKENVNSFDISSAYSNNKWEVVGRNISRSERVLELPIVSKPNPENKTEFFNYTQLHFVMYIQRTADFMKQEEAIALKLDNPGSGSSIYLTSIWLLFVLYISLLLC